MPTNDVDHQVSLATLNSKIEILLEKQEEVAKNITQIKEAIYNPEEGIFSRLRALELWKMTLLERVDERIENVKIDDGDVRMTQVESGLADLKKIQWILVGALTSVLTAFLFKDFLS